MSPVTPAQRTELDRRLADHKANPDDVIPWEEIQSSITTQLTDDIAARYSPCSEE